MKAARRELAVGDDVEAEVGLARNGRADLRVDDLLERGVAGGTRVEEALRAQQAADHLGASGLARRVHSAIFSGNLIVRQRVGASAYALPSRPCSSMPGCRGRPSAIPTARP